MQRTYRIALIVEGTFERKVKAKQEAARLLKSIRLREPWTKAGTKVTSKAKAKPSASRPPSDDEKFRAEILVQARRIVDELRLCDHTLPRVTVRWLRDAGCGYTRGNASAHAHRGKWYRRREGKHSVRLPKNLICLIAPWNTKVEYPPTNAEPVVIEGKHGRRGRVAWPPVKRTRVPYDDERMADLMAHEIMHMRFHNGHHGHGRGHRSKAFGDAVRATLAKWKAWKAGTLVIPDRTPAFALPRIEHADLTTPREGETETRSSATTDGDENQHG